LLASSTGGRLPRRANGRQRYDVDLHAGELSFRDRALGQMPQYAFKTIVTGVMKMIGLGGSKKNAINARPQQRTQNRSSPYSETGEDFIESMFQITKGFRTGINRGQGVDQDDLPIEPGEMVAKKRTNDDCPVRFVTAPHHCPKRASWRRPFG